MKMIMIILQKSQYKKYDKAINNGIVIVANKGLF